MPQPNDDGIFAMAIGFIVIGGGYFGVGLSSDDALADAR